MRRVGIILLAWLLFGLPCVAQAHAEPGMLWAGMVHLSLGNVVLGIGEGVLLAAWFKLGRKRAMACMLGAHCFFSLGWIFLLAVSNLALPWSLGNVKTGLILMVLVAWLLAVLLAHPFVMMAVGSKNWHGRTVLLGTLVMQTLSYVVLAAWYFQWGQYSLLTCVKVVGAEEIGVSARVCVYYIAQADGHVYGVNPGKAGAKKIAELEPGGREVRLVVGKGSCGQGLLDLTAVAFDADDYPSSQKTLVPNLTTAEQSLPEERPRPLRKLRFAGQTLGSARDSGLRFSAGTWANEGLQLFTRSKEMPLRGNMYLDKDKQPWLYQQHLFALATPFVSWPVRHVIQFPGDRVLLQLGEDQLCLFETMPRCASLFSPEGTAQRPCSRRMQYALAVCFAEFCGAKLGRESSGSGMGVTVGVHPAVAGELWRNRVSVSCIRPCRSD